MIVFRNTQSDKELVGHGVETDGKIIFNPGSQTGAKKSDYKFNDISIGVPGTNFQFIVKPQESCELNVNENTTFGYTIASAISEFGDNTEREYPDIYATFEAGGSSDLKCDMTYREIVNYKGKITPRVKLAENYYIEGDFGFYSNVGVSQNGGLDYSFDVYGRSRYLKSTNDLLIWFHWFEPEWEIDELLYYIMRSDNKIYSLPSVIRKNYNYHLLTYSDEEFSSELVVDAGAVNDIITVDKSVVDFYIDKISKLYKKCELNYNLTSYYSVDANVQSTLIGEYCLAGCGYYNVYATYDENDGYYHSNLIRNGIIANRISDAEISFGSGLYAVYKDKDSGLTPVYIDMVFEKDDNNEFHFISCSDNIEGIIGNQQSYDTVFTIDGYIEQRQGLKPYAVNFTVKADKPPVMVGNKIGKLQIGNIETVGINSLTKFTRIANSTVLTEDTVINDRITVKAGSVMYVFNLALKYDTATEFAFDLVVYSDIVANSGEIQWCATEIQRRP